MNNKQLADMALVNAALYIKEYCNQNFICGGCPLEDTGVCDSKVQPSGWQVKGVQDGKGKE